jgi:predicted O-methyltransferase YrrM
MGTTPKKIHEQIERIYASGSVVGENGVVYAIFPASVTRDRGEFIRKTCLSQRSVSSLEIGMAWGLSTLFILEALIKNGAGTGAHVVIDPFQSESFHGAGRRLVREAGAEEFIEFHEQKSQLVMPQLIIDGRQFDFLYIDGDHHFEGAFIDFAFAHHLLKPGGVVLFDDAWCDPVHLVCRFAEANHGYIPIPQSYRNNRQYLPASQARPFDPRPMMRAYRKPVEENKRDFHDFVPFFDGFVPYQRSDHSAFQAAAMEALQAGNSRAARRSLIEALRIRPQRFRTWLRLLRTFLPSRLQRAISRMPRREPGG